MPDNTASIECVRRYHQQSKHRFERYASGPEALDWSQQPNPFRDYHGYEKIGLPFVPQDFAVPYCALYTVDKIKPAPIHLNSIGILLQLSMGLSAWKEYQGDRWSLRCSPSSQWQLTSNRDLLD